MIGVTVLCLALGCPWYSEQELFRVSPNLITNSIIPAHNLIKSFEQFGRWFMEFLHSKGWYAPFQVRLRANRSWGKYVGLANLNTLLLVQLCDCSPSCRICLAWNHQLFLHPLFFMEDPNFIQKWGTHRSHSNQSNLRLGSHAGIHWRRDGQDGGGRLRSGVS